MLNKNGERELVYVVLVDEINELPGYDRVESARVGGWRCIVPKGQFKVGDPGIYFEIDSKVSSDNPAFAFLEKRNYKIKTQKMCKSISQGLLMHAEDFNWEIQGDEFPYIVDETGLCHFVNDESRFLTQKLGVTYADDEDNVRKAPSVDKYKKMAQRHPKIFKRPLARWLMKHNYGRKLMFFFFGRKRDKANSWPSHICDKTDVERIQNMIWILKDKNPYVATEKVDGSSCTVAAERKRFGKIKYYVCSRNVVFNSPNQQCYYDTNIYTEVFEKYELKKKITALLKDLQLSNIALQMEVYGGRVQKRDYSTSEHKIALFHIVSNGVKFSMDKVVELAEKYDIPHVPIIDDNYIFPDSIEELQSYVESAPSLIDGKPKEGIVFYDKATGAQYVKFVSPEYLLKFHG